MRGPATRSAFWGCRACKAARDEATKEAAVRKRILTCTSQLSLGRGLTQHAQYIMPGNLISFPSHYAQQPPLSHPAFTTSGRHRSAHLDRAGRCANNNNTAAVTFALLQRRHVRRSWGFASSMMPRREDLSVVRTSREDLSRGSLNAWVGKEFYTSKGF